MGIYDTPVEAVIFDIDGTLADGKQEMLFDTTSGAEIMDSDMPCGCCDMGIYSEIAMLNRVAREFSILSTADREANLPKCKKINRNCVGAKHYSDAIKEIDGE